MVEYLIPGIVAFLGLLWDKSLDKGVEKGVDVAFEQGGKILKLLNEKDPALGKAIELVTENPELMAEQPDDYGEAILVEKVKEIADADFEIQQAIADLAAMVKANPQVSSVVKNYQGIIVEGGENKFNNITLTFGGK